MSSMWSSKPCDRENLKKGPWTFEEDVRLLRYIKLHGPGRWNALAKASGLQRCGKSCRLRWVNYLRPDLKRGSITPEEERQILDLHARFGNRWSLIAEKIPGRTDNEIKNFWRSRMRKRRSVSSSRCSDGCDVAMSSPKSNTPSVTSMPNQTKYLHDCKALLEVPSNAEVSEDSTSPKMYQRSCEAVSGSYNMDPYQVEEFLKWEEDEVLSYSFPWPEQDALTAFLYELHLGTLDLSASDLTLPDITALPTHPSPEYDHSDSFLELDVGGSLWNTFPLLHDQSQMPPPPTQPEILNSHIQR